MDSLLAALADEFVSVAITGAFVITVLIVKWRDHRLATAARISANNAGGLCPHGRHFWNRSKCDGCKADLAKEFAAAEKPALYSTSAGYVSADRVVPVEFVPANDGVDEDEEEEVGLPDPVGPLCIDLPLLPPGVHVELLTDTDASWGGQHMQVAVERIVDPVNNVHTMYQHALGSCASARDNCFPIRGSGFARRIILPVWRGITRVKVRVNGDVIIDAAPEVLYAIQQYAASR